MLLFIENWLSSEYSLLKDANILVNSWFGFRVQTIIGLISEYGLLKEANFPVKMVWLQSTTCSKRLNIKQTNKTLIED